jgi:hypothetical protein
MAHSPGSPGPPAVIGVHGDESAFVLLLLAVGLDVRVFADGPDVWVRALHAAGVSAAELVAHRAVAHLRTWDPNARLLYGSVDVSGCTHDFHERLAHYAATLLSDNAAFHDLVRRCIMRRCGKLCRDSTGAAEVLSDVCLSLNGKLFKFVPASQTKAPSSKSNRTYVRVQDCISPSLACLVTYDAVMNNSLSSEMAQCAVLGFDHILPLCMRIIASQRVWNAADAARLRYHILRAPPAAAVTHPDGLALSECPPLHIVREPSYASISLRLLHDALPACQSVRDDVKLKGIFYHPESKRVAQGTFYLPTVLHNLQLEKIQATVKCVSLTTSEPFYWKRCAPHTVEGVYLPDTDINQVVSSSYEGRMKTLWVIVSKKST